MNKNFLLYIFILFLFSLFSCTKKIDYLESSQEPRLVVNCLFTTDSLFNVQVTKTIGLFEDNCLIENATVEIWSNNQLLETLQHQDSGMYISQNVRATEEMVYTLKVSAEGLPAVEASDRIPEPVKISNSYYIPNTHIDNRLSPSWPVTEIYFTFEEPQNKSNYYELIPFSIGYVHPHTGDTSYHYLEAVSDDPIITHEYISENYPLMPIFFSDKEIINNPCLIKILVLSGGLFSDDYNLNLIFKSISYNYYMYRKKLAEHLHQQGNPIDHLDLNLIFTTKTTEMYSNVKNGYGIFAGYSTHMEIITREQ